MKQEASDDSDSGEDEDGSKVSRRGIVVTIAMVDKWGDQLEVCINR